MLIKVKVFPGSKKEEVVKKGENSFEVKIVEINQGRKDKEIKY